MYKFSRILTCAALLATAGAVQAQNIGNSPYSGIGIGDISNSEGNIRNYSMGGVGVAAPNSLIINTINPALIFYNNMVAFEVGLNGQIKTLKENDASQTDGDAGLHYINFSLPVTKRWTAAVGLKPVSTVDYEIHQVVPVTGDPGKEAMVIRTGNGGLNEVFFMHGVKIVKGLTAGVSGSYLFGTISNETNVHFINDVTLQENRTFIGSQTRYSDFRFKAGAAYNHKLNQDLNINFGATYTLASDVSAERVRVQQLRSNVTNAILSEEVLENETEGSVTLPQSYAFGVSLDNGRNWSASVDVNTQQWSEYSSFNQQSTLQNSFKIGVGSEYTPDPSGSYLRRVAYRAGAYFGNTPLEFDGRQLNDMGLTFGFTLPVGEAPQTPEFQRALLHLGFSIGKRGTTEDNLLQENYYRAHIGFTLNNKWFQQRRIN